ncbi:MAG TPA: hypothetical protein VI488_12550 [Candidatus Angelobacter sp.]
MKPLLTLTSLAFVFAAVAGQEKKPDLGLPELHAIKSATLSPSYSCRSKEEFRTGYAKTALFLSAYSDDRGSPDLLFNGACGAEDYFEGSTAGDDMSLIADLGAVPLEEVTAHKAFNFKSVHSFDLYSKFAEEAKVENNHTYVVLINKREIRGLFVFSVANYVPNKKADLRYAVKEYQVMNVKSESEGFDWGMKNLAPCGQVEKVAGTPPWAVSPTSH